jgi:DNA-binding transcriptional regulator YhcF (GntR family)/ABC-type sugar transport system substrate-binding protein
MQSLGGKIDKARGIYPHTLVRERILQAITRQNYRPGDALPSEPDLAVHFGVSRMTVNRAISDLVKDGYLMREKGRGTYIRLRRNDSLRGCYVLLKEDPVTALCDEYYAELYWRLYNQLGRLGLKIYAGKLRAGIAREFTPQTAVIAIGPPSSMQAELDAIANGGSPVVVLGSTWDSPNIAFVDSDNVRGGELAARHLASLNHQNVGFLGACPEDTNTQDRSAGFLAAVEQCELRCPPEWRWMTRVAYVIDPEIERAVMSQLMREEPPTAIFCAGAKLAMRLLALCLSNEIRVPRQVSILAYDDPGFLSLAYPTLSTIKQPLPEMASAAVRALLDLAAKNGSPVHTPKLPPELVERTSIAQLPRFSPTPFAQRLQESTT